MHLFQWCWVNRSINEYEELFTDDFRFVFTDVEAVGNAPILRFEEVQIARRIFVDGSATEPRAKRIELTFVNEPLVPIVDTRGKPDPWYKLVQTRVTLRVEIGDEPPITISGDVNFFVVRGDSALIPQELKDRVFGPDNRRWYIQRWEDKTGGGGTAASVTAVMSELMRRGEAPDVVFGQARVAGAKPLPARARGAAPTAAPAALDPAWTWGDLMRLYSDRAAF